MCSQLMSCTQKKIGKRDTKHIEHWRSEAAATASCLSKVARTKKFRKAILSFFFKTWRMPGYADLGNYNGLQIFLIYKKSFPN